MHSLVLKSRVRLLYYVLKSRVRLLYYASENSAQNIVHNAYQSCSSGNIKPLPEKEKAALPLVTHNYTKITTTISVRTKYLIVSTIASRVDIYTVFVNELKQ